MQRLTVPDEIRDRRHIEPFSERQLLALTR